ncbi:MAG: ammonia-forming cytochrome c nitrite reductase subunit c552 [Verrucomicrobia bacterium]|nr:ammonia-forming cytochrome c nitrite reductase subunit c552 [Verrucomicrobiota bacterium]
MSDVFPKWTNRLPLLVIVGVSLAGTAAMAGVWYYLTPKYTRVGYQPKQPVAFSHAIHADQLGLDCRYCHSTVEKSAHSNVPATSTCMNCHNQVLKEDPKLALVRESFESGKPIPWVWIHKTPDYVYFNHSVHVNRGVSCVHCHGRIDKMDEVYHAKPLSMAFCLDCHREPEKFLRDPKLVTDLKYTVTAEKQELDGKKFVHDWKVNSSQACSTCHR